jgi:hypothetical protein
VDANSDADKYHCDGYAVRENKIETIVLVHVAGWKVLYWYALVG